MIILCLYRFVIDTADANVYNLVQNNKYLTYPGRVGLKYSHREGLQMLRAILCKCNAECRLEKLPKKSDFIPRLERHGFARYSKRLMKVR